jgi:hypothetical protein
MRFRSSLVAVFAASLTGLAAAADPPDAGKVAWAKDYPKAVDAKPGETKGAVELLGEAEPKPGWVVKEVLFDYAPAAGGEMAKPTKLKFQDNKWGALDEKDKKKIVPAKVPIEKGKWEVRVLILFEGTDITGKKLTVPYQTRWKIIEVK